MIRFLIKVLMLSLFSCCTSFVFAGPVYETKINTSPSLPTDTVPKELEGVTITEHLGDKLNLGIKFTDQNGKIVTIGDLLKNGKPLILSLNYYRCKTLCGLQLQNLATTMKELNWPIGKDFTMATVSFDHTDTPALATEKQKEFLDIAQQPNGEWNFLIGSQLNIDQLTRAIGFYYKFIPERNEYSHTAAIFFISPNGTISRYLYGINYKVNDVKFALMEAADNKIGSTTDKFLLFCCNYDPSLGRYTGLAVGLMRVGGILTILFLLSIIFYYSGFRKKYFKKK